MLTHVFHKFGKQRNKIIRQNSLDGLDAICGLELDGWDAPLQGPWGLSVYATPFTERL